MDCIARNGEKVPHGETFVPGPDYCTMCKCYKGKAHLCRAVLCQPPQDCKFFRTGELCCDFICIEKFPPLHDDRDKGTSSDMGLRMVGSTITAILSLALLLFLIHRLRQRKRRDAQRRCFEENLDVASGMPSDSCHSNPCCHNSVYGCGNDDLFVEISSPTSPWKHPYYFQYREPPPSYNEAVRNDPHIPVCVQASSESSFSSFPPMRTVSSHVSSATQERNAESSSGNRSTTDLREASCSASRMAGNDNGFSFVGPSPSVQDPQNGTILSDQIYEEASACRNGQALNGSAFRGSLNNPSPNRTHSISHQILSLHNITSQSDL